MNKRYKIITIAASLAFVMLLTVTTHFVITQMPDSSQLDLETSTAIDFNAFDATTGLTPLMQAAIDSDIERTKILLAQGADPNIVSANNDKDNALNNAIFNGGKLGSLAVAQALMAAGADVNAKNSRGMAPIHFMMQITNAGNRLIILRELMGRGAHINAQNEDGSTMLHIAVTNLDYDWIDLLNDNYGQVINYDIKDNRGRTPLELALERGLTGDVELGTQSVETSLRKRPVYIGEDFNVQKTDEFGRTGLQLAVIRDDMKYVTSLLSHNPNLTHQDYYGNSVMHHAVLNLNPVPFIEVLLKAKAPVNIANNRGETPLFGVMKIRDKALRSRVAQLLIDAGSPVANRNAAGKTVADLAGVDNDRNLLYLLGMAIKKQLDQPKEIERPAKRQKVS